MSFCDRNLCMYIGLCSVFSKSPNKRASVPSAFVYHEITEDRGAGGKDFSHLIKNDCHHQIYCCQSHQCIVIIMIIIYHPHLSFPIFSPASAPTFLYPIQTKSQRVKFSLVALCVLLFQKQHVKLRIHRIFFLHTV